MQQAQDNFSDDLSASDIPRTRDSDARVEAILTAERILVDMLARLVIDAIQSQSPPHEADTP
jgi:hypothetical protein